MHFAALLMLSPALLSAGRIAQRLRLPLITGYVLAGMLVGPYGLNLLTTDGLQQLVLVRLRKE